MERSNPTIELTDDDGEMRNETTKKRTKKQPKEIDAKRQRPLKDNIELAWIYVSQPFYIKDKETTDELLHDFGISSACDFSLIFKHIELCALAHTLKDAYQRQFLSIFSTNGVSIHDKLVLLDEDPALPKLQVEEYVAAKLKLARIIRGFDEKEYCFFARSTCAKVYIDENPGYVESQFKDGETLSLARLFHGKHATFVTSYKEGKPVVRQIFTPHYVSDDSSIDY
jgi:hypothetical protein